MNRIALMVLRNLLKVPRLYGKLCHYAKFTDRYPEQEKWDLIHHIMTLAVKAGNVDLQVTGVENIPAEGGCMLYGNHQGMFDVLALASSCPVPLSIVYKKEIRDVPLLKQIYACTKSFAIDREDPRQSLQVIQAVTKEVQSGRRYIIFPEGTRSRTGNQLLSFHGGSFRPAIKAKCPIVPFALIDSFKVLDEKGSHWTKVQLHFLPPIPYEEFKDLKGVEVAALVKSRIEACIQANL